ncbi:MAG: hypothetical protein O3A78_12670 [Nitrospinae bacterium]|jgi:hypothetical protein|nr:hypothetical protein [Nitrospinota bacterium]MDA1110641.1 hypothetical protein [Nitrospinota bacterium]
MNKLEAIESLVSKIPCPVCLNSRFQVNLSCDSPHSPCDYHAVCGHCHYKFVVTEDYDQNRDIFQSVKEHIEKNGCPKCESKDLDIEFMCDLGSQDCFFLVKCGKGGHYSKVDQKGIFYLFH